MAAARLGAVGSFRALLGGVMSYGQVESEVGRRPEPDTWFELAACHGANPDIFYPGHGDHAGIVRAKAVCATCPVKTECLEYALTNREVFGVWGGCSERQRRRMRSDRAALRAIGGEGSVTDEAP